VQRTFHTLPNGALRAADHGSGGPG